MWLSIPKRTGMKARVAEGPHQSAIWFMNIEVSGSDLTTDSGNVCEGRFLDFKALITSFALFGDQALTGLQCDQ